MTSKWWKHSFLRVLIKRAAILNCWIVEVPPTFRPKIPTSEAFRGESRPGTQKFQLQRIIECTISHQHKDQLGVISLIDQSAQDKSLNSAICIYFCTFVLCLIEHSTWIIARPLIRNGRLTILNPKTRFSACFLFIDKSNSHHRSTLCTTMREQPETFGSRSFTSTQQKSHEISAGSSITERARRFWAGREQICTWARTIRERPSVVWQQTSRNLGLKWINNALILKDCAFDLWQD